MRRLGGGPRAALRSLAWIDEFFRKARGHIYAREEDGVVILPPNQVYKANATGISILRHFLRGGRVRGIPGIEEADRARDVAGFVSDLRSRYLGEPAPAGDTVPYDFQYTTLPILGEIAVTYRCNNACLFCYAGCGAGSCAPPPGSTARSPAATPSELAGGREMSLSECRRIIRLFKEEAKIPFFSFTGGEPLLRPDLEEMIRYAVGIGLQVNLITNATLADAPRAASLYRAGLRTAQVSVESPDEERHDHLTARPGSWKRTLAGLACLQAAGVSVQTNTTVTAANAEDTPRMPAFLKGLGVSRFAMNLYLPPGASAEEAGPHAAGLFVPYTRAGSIIEAVRAAARAHGLTFYWYSPIPHCHYNTIAKGLGNKSCAAMDGLLSVSSAGDVLPCSSYPQPMGNLLRQGFPEIWFSSRAQFFKQKRYAPTECGGCESFTACQAACPLYWRYAGTSEIRNPAAGVTAGARTAAPAPAAS
ncbi:MAG TPA: radical SAM protein [Spirochaetia bacterium]|nr:radical SAM protein [Spirochaetia bacterium]